jgi:hypothetical protein
VSGFSKHQLIFFTGLANEMCPKRISHGSMRRVPRVSPDVDLQFKEWKIPKGVSSAFFHGIGSKKSLIDANILLYFTDTSRHVSVHDAHRCSSVSRALQIQARALARGLRSSYEQKLHSIL